MANISVIKLKVRRGTNAERQMIILDQGELGFTTDNNGQRLFVGDGTTYGGLSVGTKFYTTAGLPDTTISTILTGDMLLDNSGGNTGLYVLTGSDYSTYTSYAKIK